MSTTISGDTGVDKATNQAVKNAMGVTGIAPIFGCRAWVNFDGTRNEADTGASVIGQNVKIRASGNVSSVVKNAVGDYTVNFTTAMPDANYGVNGLSSADSTGYGDTSAIIFRIKSSVVPTVSAVRVINGGGGSSIMDCIYGHISIFR